MWIDSFLFLDRTDAGEKLAAKLGQDPLIRNASPDELLLLSIPRGGVIVGMAIAQMLGCAHEVIIAKKVGLPGQTELAIGAIAEDGAAILNEAMLPDYEAKTYYLSQVIEAARANVQTYIKKFRQGRDLVLKDRIVILVDDGIATGETMKAAIRWAVNPNRTDRPKQVIVAVPVCAMITATEIKKMVDRFVYLELPGTFLAVSQFYWDFDSVGDEQVLAYLAPKKEKG